WVRLLRDSLQPTGAIDMSNGRDKLTFLLAYLEHLHHEWNGVVLFEPICSDFLEHGGRKRSEGFPTLDLAVEQRLHVGAAWVTQDRAVAEGPRAPFHPSLKPADDEAVRDGCSGAATKRRFIGNLLDRGTSGENVRPVRRQELFYFREAESRTPICMIHHECA